MGVKTALHAYVSELKRCRRLTQAEEIEFQSRHLAGDRSATEALIESVLPITWHIVNAVHSQFGGDLADMVQEANEAVLKKLDAFDPSEGRLSTWARVCVKSRLRQVRQHGKRMKRSAALVSTEQPVFEDIKIIDTISDEEPLVDELYESLEASVVVAEVLQRLHLDRRDKLVLHYRLMQDEPMTLTEVGRMANISKQAVFHREQLLKQRIREEIEKHELFDRVILRAAA